MTKKRQPKLLALVTAIAVVVALMQATPLALLEPKMGGFAQGFAVGLCIVLFVVWLSRRAGAVKK